MTTVRLVKSRSLLFVVGIVAACMQRTSAQAEDAGAEHVYVTWEGSEPDRGASAWFIKRFVDTQAEFKTVPQNAPLPAGTAFDVPESRFQRSARYSTFELLVNEYPVADPAVKRIAVIIHDIEINTWQRKIAPETPAVLVAMEKIRSGYGTNSVPLNCQITFFEGVYSKLKESSDQGQQLAFGIPDECDAVSLTKIE